MGEGRGQVRTVAEVMKRYHSPRDETQEERQRLDMAECSQTSGCVGHWGSWESGEVVCMDLDSEVQLKVIILLVVSTCVRPVSKAMNHSCKLFVWYLLSFSNLRIVKLL